MTEGLARPIYAVLALAPFYGRFNGVCGRARAKQASRSGPVGFPFGEVSGIPVTHPDA
jgi:hypothetical protein